MEYIIGLAVIVVIAYVITRMSKSSVDASKVEFVAPAEQAPVVEEKVEEPAPAPVVEAAPVVVEAAPAKKPRKPRAPKVEQAPVKAPAKAAVKATATKKPVAVKAPAKAAVKAVKAPAKKPAAVKAKSKKA